MAYVSAFPVSVGTAMDVVAEQCIRRGLHNTSTWLSELALDATDAVLDAPLPTGSRLVATALMDEALSAPLSRPTAAATRTDLCTPPRRGRDGEGWATSPAATFTEERDAPRRSATCEGGDAAIREKNAEEAELDANEEDMMVLLRVRRYQRVALGLFLRGEYQHCHHILTTALREYDMCVGVDSSASGDAVPFEGRASAASEGGPLLDSYRSVAPHASGTPHSRRSLHGPNWSERGEASSATAAAAAAASAAGAAPLGSVSFATSRLPAAMQFLALYALYMDGQKVKQTSAHPHRTMNPHLRVLRALLMEALRNPSNRLPPLSSSSPCSEWTQTPGEAKTGGRDTAMSAAPPSPVSCAGGSSPSQTHTTAAAAVAGAAGEGGEHTPMAGTAAGPTSTFTVTHTATGGTYKASSSADSASRAGGVPSTAPPLSATSPAGAKSGSRTTFTPGTYKDEQKEEDDGADISQRKRPLPPDAAVAGAATAITADEAPHVDLLQRDPYLCWLMGVVLRDLGMKQEAATYLLAAACVNPLLWCAWEDLSTLVTRETQLEEIAEVLGDLSPRFMAELFMAHVKAALGITPLALNTALLQTSVPAAPGTAASSPAAAEEHAHGQREGGPEEEKDDGQQRAKAQPATWSPTPTAPQTTQSYATLPQRHRTRHGEGSAHSAPSYTAGTGGSASGGGLDGPRSAGAATSSRAPRLVNSWELLLQLFPSSLYLLTQLAGFFYHQRKELDKAERLYAHVHRVNPYRLDGVPDYSNILFMKSDLLGLSSLAQQVYHLDAFRAESNFVVGNYYVLLGQHERSVLHFRRATAIQPNFVTAWTLLGHAYVETKNTTAAVEAYRTAVDLDQRDYRGWYNLGQIYELLQAYPHALYYYWHTTSLRPTDPRMWTAVGNCLRHEGRLAESTVCLERAETYESPHSALYPALVTQISAFYIERQNFARACVYLEKLLHSSAASESDRAFALPFVIQYHVMEAQEMMELPARSPSYEPTAFSSTPLAAPTQRSPASSSASSLSPSARRGRRSDGGGGGVEGGGSPQHGVPRTAATAQQQQQQAAGVGAGRDWGAGFAGDARTEHALTHLNTADLYVEELAALVGVLPTQVPAPAASAASAQQRATSSSTPAVSGVGGSTGDRTASPHASNANGQAGAGEGPTLTQEAEHMARFITRMQRDIAMNRLLIHRQTHPHHPPPPSAPYAPSAPPSFGGGGGGFGGRRMT